MKNIRFYLAILVFSLGFFFASYLAYFKIDYQEAYSAQTAFEKYAQVPASLEQGATMILNVLPSDRQKIKQHIKNNLPIIESEIDHIYVNSLFKIFEKDTSYKDSPIDIYVLDIGFNAFALPGEIIVIGSDLLSSLETESQLLGIMAHELGHIQLGHVDQFITFQKLLSKLIDPSYTFILDDLFNELNTNEHEKTLETEADTYAFGKLISLNYSPFALSETFHIMQNYSPSPRKASLIQDYYSSHPYLDLRKEHWQQEASKYQNQKFYQGKKNFEDKIPRNEALYEEEWK